MELTELMSAFAETLGIEGIEVKEGICSMTIDDIPMEFTESPGGLAVWGAAILAAATGTTRILRVAAARGLQRGGHATYDVRRARTTSRLTTCVRRTS